MVIDSYCLMTNHVHMIVQTGSQELWKFMKKLLGSYARYFNDRYDYKGHLFEKRYTACLIEDDRYLLEASRYIHLNPVKALMVRGPLDYEYSSYKAFVGEENAGKMLRTSRILDCFRANPKEQYRMFVEGKISHAEEELLIQKEMGEDEKWLPW